MRVEVSSAISPSLPTQFSTDLGAVSGSRFSWKRFILKLGDSSARIGWRGLIACLAIPGFITMAGLQAAPIDHGPIVAAFYVLAVVFSALRWGRWAVVLSAISSVCLFDYFFILPYRSLPAGDGWYPIALLGLLTTGLIISALVVVTREEAELSRRNESHIAALCALTQSLAAETKLDAIVAALERHVLATFERPIIVFLPDAGGFCERTLGAALAFDRAEYAAVACAFEKDEETGQDTGHFSDSALHYLPLKAWRGVVGVVGILASDWKAWRSNGRQQLLRGFMSQAALAVTRADLVRKAQQAEVLQESDKLQKALLNSVSHNLRSPLASIMGALNSVLEDGTLIDVPTQHSLLRTAQAEAVRLNSLFQNLLDMTRLEGGAVRVKAEPCDVNDVVGAALQQLSEAVRGRPVLVNIARCLPLVSMDHVLIVQVLVNMLDNALKYSPLDAPIEIDARLNSGQLEICVSDRGRGIPEQDLGRVFDKFFRGTHPAPPRGAGLGLSICKGFVEAHKGRMLAKRRRNGGTEVAFFLPLEVDGA